MKKHMLSIIASIVICALLLIGCGGGGGGGGGNPAAPTQTGTLKGTVTLPSANFRANLDGSASDTVNIASDTALNNHVLRANQSQSLEGTKVWLEGYPDITGIADSEGNYIIENVPFGENRVVANIKIGDEEYKWRSEVQKVENTTIIIVPQIVMIPAKTSISGIVYDAVSQKAIQGVIVEVWGQRSTSGRDGKYTVFNMPAGSWDVTYSKNGYQTFTTPMSFADGVETSGNFYLVPEGTNDPNIASNSGSVALKELIPAYKAEFVSNQTTISAFFNGAVINTNYAKISFTSGNPKKVGGSFSFENDRVIYTHNEEWPANTKIAGSISDLRDYFGKTIASIPFEFTTTANIVKSISPANNANKIEVDTPIVITFNTKMNTSQNLVDLVKIFDNSNGSYVPTASNSSNINEGTSLKLNTNQFSWSSSSNNDVLTIKNVQLEPDKTYTVQLSENLLDKNGNKLQGTRAFSFSTRGAVYLVFDTPNTYHHSDLRFEICGDGIITDVSKANITLSENVTGKFSVKNNYITFKLNDNQSWTVGKTVNGKISGLTDKYGIKVNDYEFSFYVNYFEGTGTEEDPYLITNADDLNNLRFVSEKNYYFKQTQDIDLTAYDENKISEDYIVRGWEPISGLKGNYNGDNHKITNLYINGGWECGLFADSSYSSIRNLGIEVSSKGISTSNIDMCGALIGQACETIIENCWVKGSGTISGGECGALVGGVREKSIIRNCFSDIEVIGGLDSVGGLVGGIGENCIVENCYSLGKVSGSCYVGGLFGRGSKVTINNCFSKSEVTAVYQSTQCSGGLFGELFESTVNNCYFVGKLKTDESEGTDNPTFTMGGLIGYSSGVSIINCYSKCEIEGYSGHIGGILGEDYSGYTIYGGNQLINCYSGCSSIKTQTGEVARIIVPVSYSGKYASTITNCYANKNMTLTKNGVSTQPGLQNPLPETVALDGVDGANLPDNPDWKNKIFKDGYENGETFDDVWEIGNSGLPILKNMPDNTVQ